MFCFDLFAWFAPRVLLPQDTNTNMLMLLRWIHFLAGITWVGLLYFFNLVNVPFLKQLDTPTRTKVVPTLMPRALWWFRWGSVVTVLAGIAYWMVIVASDRRSGQAGDFPNADSGPVISSFFAIWTIAFVIEMGILMSPARPLHKGPVLAVIITVIVVAASWIFLSINSHGWESNRLLSIGIGGGLGWFMMLNVWGIIWRMQKKIIRWTAELGPGEVMPEAATRLARLAFLASRANFFLSFPMLFFMAAASHYPMFGSL